MRVIAGEVKGFPLKTIEGETTRPTRDMVREALFSILQWETPESTFLDLFAGSGAIGIEALSRGAKHVVFVDQNRDCIKVIRENLMKTRLEAKASVFQTDYQNAISHFTTEMFDIIFLDPPYHQGMGTNAMLKLSEKNVLKENGIIVLETDTKEEVPEEIGKFILFNYKRYGRNILSFFKRKE